MSSGMELAFIILILSIVGTTVVLKKQSIRESGNIFELAYMHISLIIACIIVLVPIGIFMLLL